MSTPTIPAGNLYMNATTYNGTGTTQVVTNGVTGQSFQPDFIWFKSRSGAYNHALYDSIRGNTLALNSNTTSADISTGTDFVSFNSNGFTVNTYNVVNSPNYPGETAVAWQWKAGGTAVSNNAGFVPSQVSANTTSGFSIATYTGNGSNSSVGHGLGVAPSMIIIKGRSTTSDWAVYHASVGTGKYLILDSTSATTTDANYFSGVTSTLFSMTGSASLMNTNSATYVAYCWAPIAGYSQFGSYTGNGSADGPFVYTGFRPRYIITKESSGTSDWIIKDTSRDTYNVAGNTLLADASDAEYSNNNVMDILSNGFKFRTTGAGVNGSGQTYIYAAFAEVPFKFANGR